MKICYRAGFAGATLARILADSGEKVLVVDKRCHIGGISYDYKDENGITVHKYGSHIFHTQSPKVWSFLRRFGDFNTYMHRVHAIIDGIETHIPFNLDTIGDIFPNSLANRIQEKLISNYAYNSKIPIMEFLRQNDRICVLADFIMKKYFWIQHEAMGKSPEQLDLICIFTNSSCSGKRPTLLH
ncbi:MAG: NAD(P)-binding protein [Bacilli bacterium]